MTNQTTQAPPAAATPPAAPKGKAQSFVVTQMAKYQNLLGAFEAVVRGADGTKIAATGNTEARCLANLRKKVAAAGWGKTAAEDENGYASWFNDQGEEADE